MFFLCAPQVYLSVVTTRLGYVDYYHPKGACKSRRESEMSFKKIAPVKHHRHCKPVPPKPAKKTKPHRPAAPPADKK
jgi:hypothetical protein